MALLGSPRISDIVLIDGRIEVEGHPVADISGLSVPEIQALSFHDPAPFRVDPAAIPDAQKAIMAANGAALAAYAGTPAMADPTLLGRLSGVAIPTQVLWGESDRIVELAYGRAYSAAIQGRVSWCSPLPVTCRRWRLQISCCKRSRTRAKSPTRAHPAWSRRLGHLGFIKSWSQNSAGKYLFAQDVGMSAVVGQLSQNLQVHPAKRAGPGRVAGHNGIQ